jgi:hypothetical protein
MSADIHSQADDLVRYYAELQRRLTQVGVRDVGDLLELAERLRAALGAVSTQEIAWAAEQTQGLLEALVRMDDNLEALRRLKVTLEQGG